MTTGSDVQARCRRGALRTLEINVMAKKQKKENYVLTRFREKVFKFWVLVCPAAPGACVLVIVDCFVDCWGGKERN